MNSFDLVVFLYVPTEVRLARLRRRERDRFGEALDPGGSMHDQHEAFVAHAAGYDCGLSGTRTLHTDKAWLAYLRCPVLSIVGECGTGDQIRRVFSFWGNDGDAPAAASGLATFTRGVVLEPGEVVAANQ
jgi:hypothetical protein